MVRPVDLLQMPITYDIIVSDFGRDATIEYLRFMATSEKRLITKILEKNGHEFFDEYRRIMFSAIGDLAFFKETAIAESVARIGYLTEDILIGLGLSSMSEEFVDRVSLAVIQEVVAAMDRGHQRFRVMVPCNGLSVLANRVETIISSVDELRRIGAAYVPRRSVIDKLGAADITVHTVPVAVMQYLARERKGTEKLRVLVLGTPGVNGIYEGLATSYPANILPLNTTDYELIDEAIVASIGGNREKVAFCREKLQKDIIEPRRRLFDDMIVLEACTDFCFGVGLSSLEVFANAMVADCYQTKVW